MPPSTHSEGVELLWYFFFYDPHRLGYNAHFRNIITATYEVMFCDHHNLFDQGPALTSLVIKAI